MNNRTTEITISDKVVTVLGNAELAMLIDAAMIGLEGAPDAAAADRLWKKLNLIDAAMQAGV
jgi:hypothetical protein